jgi:hypothetical protein
MAGVIFFHADKSFDVVLKKRVRTEVEGGSKEGIAVGVGVR